MARIYYTAITGAAESGYINDRGDHDENVDAIVRSIARKLGATGMRHHTASPMDREIHVTTGDRNRDGSISYPQNSIVRIES